MANLSTPDSDKEVAEYRYQLLEETMDLVLKLQNRLVLKAMIYAAETKGGFNNGKD